MSVYRRLREGLDSWSNKTETMGVSPTHKTGISRQYFPIQSGVPPEMGSPNPSKAIRQQ